MASSVNQRNNLSQLDLVHFCSHSNSNSSQPPLDSLVDRLHKQEHLVVYLASPLSPLNLVIQLVLRSINNSLKVAVFLDRKIHNKSHHSLNLQDSLVDQWEWPNRKFLISEPLLQCKIQAGFSDHKQPSLSNNYLVNHSNSNKHSKDRQANLRNCLGHQPHMHLVIFSNNNHSRNLHSISNNKISLPLHKDYLISNSHRILVKQSTLTLNSTIRV